MNTQSAECTHKISNLYTVGEIDLVLSPGFVKWIVSFAWTTAVFDLPTRSSFTYTALRLPNRTAPAYAR